MGGGGVGPQAVRLSNSRTSSSDTAGSLCDVMLVGPDGPLFDTATNERGMRIESNRIVAAC